MKKINLPFFYQLGAVLGRLAEMEAKDSARSDIWLASLRVETNVRALLDLFPTLTVCRGTGRELISAIEEVDEFIRQTPAGKWQKQDYSVDLKFRKLIYKAKEFQTVLSAELQTLETYHVTQKGIYDTTALIAQAENILPMPMLNKIDQKVVTEIRESGKCLAFDCATASGFHIMRATELVMHQYYISVCKPKSKKNLDGWAPYISAFYKLSEDVKTKEDVRGDVKKVIALLQQIKDQDRNLIMHPEAVLTPDDAHILFETAKGAIIAMADKLRAVKKK